MRYGHRHALKILIVFQVCNFRSHVSKITKDTWWTWIVTLLLYVFFFDGLCMLWLNETTIESKPKKSVVSDIVLLVYQEKYQPRFAKGVNNSIVWCVVSNISSPQQVWQQDDILLNDWQTNIRLQLKRGLFSYLFTYVLPTLFNFYMMFNKY